MDKIDRTGILDKNPKTDKRIVNDFDKLEIELNKLGVSIKPIYDLNPPLDDSHFYPSIKSKNSKKEE
jgi:hypothetical protein